MPLAHARTGPRRGSVGGSGSPGTRPGPSRDCRSRSVGSCFAAEGILHIFHLSCSPPAQCPEPGRLCALGSSPRRLGGSGAVQGEDRDLFPLGSAWREVWRAPRATFVLLIAFLSYVDVRPRFPPSEIRPCTCLTYSGSPLLDSPGCVRTRSCGLAAPAPLPGTCRR